MTAAEHDPSIDEIKDLASSIWDLEAEVERLGGWEDRNFKLSIAGGLNFVLKVSPPGALRETLDNQVALLAHLAGTELAPLVPRVVPTADGSELHRITSHDGTIRWVRMLTWLEGRRLLDVEERPPVLLEDIGGTLGRLDLALGGFDHPATRKIHEWDVMAVCDLAHLTRHIDDPRRRALVEDHLERCAAVLLPRRGELVHGVIHADANDHNLLITAADGDPRLSGIIDFSDALHSPLVADLGICLAYLMLDRADPFADAGDVVRGYHDVRPLTALERELLPELALGRVCSSLLHAAHGLVREPDNDYLQISAAPMWRLLDRLDVGHTTELARAVERACS